MIIQFCSGKQEKQFHSKADLGESGTENDEFSDKLFRKRYASQTFYTIDDLRKAAGESGTECNIIYSIFFAS